MTSCEEVAGSEVGTDGGVQWGSLRADRPAARDVDSKGEGGSEYSAWKVDVKRVDSIRHRRGE